MEEGITNKGKPIKTLPTKPQFEDFSTFTDLKGSEGAKFLFSFAGQL